MRRYSSALPSSAVLLCFARTAATTSSSSGATVSSSSSPPRPPSSSASSSSSFFPSPVSFPSYSPSSLTPQERAKRILRREALKGTDRQQQQQQKSKGGDNDDGTSVNFARSDDDPELYHGLSPESLSYLYEAEREEEAAAAATTQAATATARRARAADVAEGLPPPLAISTTDIPEHRASSFLNLAGEADRLGAQRLAREAEDLSGHDRVSRAALPPKAQRALATERSLLQLLDSSAADRLKADASLELTSRITRDQLPIRARVVEEVFSLWVRVTNENLLLGSQEKQRGGSETSSMFVDGGDQGGGRGEFFSKNENSNGKLSLSSSSSSPVEFLEPMTTLYFHLRSTHTAPTPILIEHFMTMVHIASTSSADVGGGKSKHLMDLANRLVLDSDRFTILLTRITYATFFDVCSINNSMDIALTTFADAKQNLFLEPDGGMVRSITSGLVKNGFVAEALAFLARTSEVQVDLVYVNSILELLVHSEEPMAAFAALRGLQHSGLVPNSATCYHLLCACQASGQWEVGAPFVLALMQKMQIKGDNDSLNLLLKGLMLCQGMGQYANQLYLAMKQKEIAVFPEVEKALPERVQKRGEKIVRGVQKLRRDRRLLSSPEKVLEASRQEVAALQGGGERGGGASFAAAVVDAANTGGGGGTSNNHDHQRSFSSSSRSERDVVVEQFLRHLASHGKLASPRSAGGPSLGTLCRFALRRHILSATRGGSHYNFPGIDLEERAQRYLRLRRQLVGMKARHRNNVLSSVALQRYADDDKYRRRGGGEQREVDHQQNTSSPSSSVSSAEEGQKKTSDDEERQKTVERRHHRLQETFLNKQDELRAIAKSLKPVMWKEVHRFFYGVAPVSTRVVDMNKSKRKETGRKRRNLRW